MKFKKYFVMNNLVEVMLPIQSYIDKNREKIDESLVSLRLMKEVDMFLDANNIPNKLLAKDLGYSESFISQLMSGVKKINTSFINKFEKNYKVRVIFSIVKEDEKDDNIISISSKSFLNVDFNVSRKNTKTLSLSQVISYNDCGEYVDYEEIKYNLY